MFLFGSCGKAGKRRDEVRTWLERVAPGRFTVESVSSDATWHQYDPNRYAVELHDVGDPDLRVKFRWYAATTDGGMTPGELEDLYAAARRDLALSRELVQRLKRQGLEKITAGVRSGRAEILVFQELTSENQSAVFESLRAALNPWLPAAELDTRIAFLEETAYATTYADLIPAAEVQAQSNWRNDNTVYEFVTHWNLLPAAGNMAAALQIGMGAREIAHRRRAYALLLEQLTGAAPPSAVTRRLKAPYRIEMDQLIEFEIRPETPMSIRYGFPYCTGVSPGDTSCAERYEGFVYCTYDTRAGTIADITIEESEY